jgi:hypothetical protein
MKWYGRQSRNMKPDDRIRFAHIVDALNNAIGFTQGRSRQDLDTDPMLILALMQAIQIVGEAANNIRQETQEQYPQIPWRARLSACGIASCTLTRTWTTTSCGPRLSPAHVSWRKTLSFSILA